MKKSLKITLIVIGVLVGIVVVDTLQAKIFNNSPILKVRENLNGGRTAYIDKGVFVNHYYCINKEEKTLFKGAKYTCPELEENKESTNGFDKEFLQCIENELGGYLVTEKDNLIEIPLSEIKKDDNEKIEYYKGAYASEHPDNMYVIVYPKNGTYESNIMKDFDKYFYENFSVYQTSESPFGPTIYIHNANNDVDFKDIFNKCKISSNSNDGKSMPSKTTNKLKDTKKIVIKTNNEELGTISNEDTLNKILNTISSSKQYGDAFLCDGHGFDFEMYDKNSKLIDTIYVWSDGNRLIPASISGEGCSYYSISDNIDLRKIIEDETDYIFYNILDVRDNDNQKLQLFYKNDKNNYYLKSENTNEILIKFMLNNQVMTLKYALENNYISAEKVAIDYPNILIKE